PLSPHTSLLIIARPPRSPLFPYTTLFRSHGHRCGGILRQVRNDGANVQHQIYQQPERRAGQRAKLTGEDRLTRVKRIAADFDVRSEEHTSELQSLTNLVCRLLLEKKK